MATRARIPGPAQAPRPTRHPATGLLAAGTTTRAAATEVFERPLIQQGGARLVLASASSARQELLRSAGLRFEARPAFIDETAVKHAARACMAQPGETALELARRKARMVASPGEMVIGCDQLLVSGGHWYDKPVDMHAARRQLQALRGQTHVLETACVVLQNGREVFDHLARPRLSMRAFSDAFLDAYLAAEGEIVLSSVGAYRLEGLGIQLFDTIDGDHSAILGLPLLPLLGFLRANGMIMD